MQDVKRPLLMFGAFALAARLSVACGTLLPEETDLPDAADRSDGSIDAPSAADGGASEASSDANVPDVVSTCRDVIFDGFEDPSSAPEVTWIENASEGTVSFTTEPADVHSGQGAIRISTPANDSAYAQLATTAVGGNCTLTIDFWVKRKLSDGSGVILFELAASGRVRQLRQSDSFLYLDHETVADAAIGQPTTLELSKSFTHDAYHHVVIRYELSGSMTINVDDAAPKLLPGAAKDAPATQIRFGVLGFTGATTAKELVFDDVLVY